MQGEMRIKGQQLGDEMKGRQRYRVNVKRGRSDAYTFFVAIISVVNAIALCRAKVGLAADCRAARTSRSTPCCTM